MQTKKSKKKYYHIISMIIAALGLIFSCVCIIQANNEYKLYDGLSGNMPVSEKIRKHIEDIEHVLQAKEAIDHHEYEKALSFISGTSIEDYYNRGTIQTLLAYANALHDTTSGIQKAQILIAQAKNNFDIAKKLGPSSVLAKAINTNQYTLDSLSPIIEIKQCYALGNTIIESISNILATIQDIKQTLDQEEQYIEKKAKALPVECHQKLAYIADISKEQVGLLQMNMLETKKIYLSDLSNKIHNPETCIDIPYNDITLYVQKGNEGLKAYQQLHQNTITALTSNDKKMINELCDENKNDAQLNKQIQSSIQELLEKLGENTLEDQQRRVNNQKNYKEFFSEDEKEILKTIQKTNKERIDTLLKIRGKRNYDPKKYIENMFNQFYGNTGDFIDLHK